MSSATLGDLKIHLIRAGVYWWDGGAFFGVVPKTLWSRETPVDELNRIPAAFNCYLVRGGGHTILIETGGGDKLDTRARERMKLPPEPALLPAVIAEQGFDPDEIDIVINSHLHWDHCGGNTILGPDGVRPAFPRARYYASRPEWEHAHLRHPRDSVSYVDANYDPLVESGQMTLVDGDCEVAPGVFLRRAPGHNRDLCVVTVENNSGTFFFMSDMVPLAAHVRPTWVAAFDLDPIQAIDTKMRWLQAASEGHWLCGFAHEPVLDFARIEPDPKARFAAVPAER
jgi:glyoxylase-like metal-dependent hydrolase (beta-lactamase superfamily II)